MNKILALTAFSLLFFWFNLETESNKEMTNKENNSIQNKGKQFFNYDEIDYYSISLDEKKINELYENQSKSVLDSLKMGVILGEIPTTISDLAFIDQLD